MLQCAAGHVEGVVGNGQEAPRPVDRADRAGPGRSLPRSAPSVARSACGRCSGIGSDSRRWPREQFFVLGQARGIGSLFAQMCEDGVDKRLRSRATSSRKELERRLAGRFRPVLAVSGDEV